ncbi:MAG: hypothetical protein ACFFG0_19875 [Candidatus Thorarchaeota archaeon]
MMTVMNACIGSWKCGKSRDFATFPHHLLLFENKNPKKLPKRGGGRRKRLLSSCRGAFQAFH